MLKVTVQAIQGQAGAAGQPKAAMTARFGKPAPMTRQATAAFESRRDFTHAFQVACRNALAIIARKTVRDKEGRLRAGEPLKARFSAPEKLQPSIPDPSGVPGRGGSAQVNTKSL